MAEKDVVDTSKLVLMVGGGTLLTIATIFGVQALHYWQEQRTFAEKNDHAPRELTATREAGVELLKGNRAVSTEAANKRYAISIDEAKARVVGKLSQ